MKAHYGKDLPPRRPLTHTHFIFFVFWETNSLLIENVPVVSGSRIKITYHWISTPQGWVTSLWVHVIKTWSLVFLLSFFVCLSHKLFVSNLRTRIVPNKWTINFRTCSCKIDLLLLAKRSHQVDNSYSRLSIDRWTDLNNEFKNLVISKGKLRIWERFESPTFVRKFRNNHLQTSQNVLWVHFLAQFARKGNGVLTCLRCAIIVLKRQLFYAWSFQHFKTLENF